MSYMIPTTDQEIAGLGISSHTQSAIVHQHTAHAAFESHVDMRSIVQACTKCYCNRRPCEVHKCKGPCIQDGDLRVSGHGAATHGYLLSVTSCRLYTHTVELHGLRALAVDLWVFVTLLAATSSCWACIRRICMQLPPGPYPRASTFHPKLDAFMIPAGADGDDSSIVGNVAFDEVTGEPFPR